MKNKVLIYKDDGVDAFCLAALYSELSKKIGQEKIRFITAKQIKENDDWSKDAKALFIGGGADRFYAAKLNGKANKKIKDFVKSGGTYFGICAGSYYSCSDIDYDFNDLKIKEKRQLSFFDATAIGPIGKKDNKLDDDNTDISAVRLSGNKGAFMYEKGPFFDVRSTNIDKLFNYDFANDQEKTAIMKKSYGKGTVIASAVHFEVSGSFLQDNFEKYSHKKQKPKKIIKALKKSEKSRDKLFTALLKEAKILNKANLNTFYNDLSNIKTRQNQK